MGDRTGQAAAVCGGKRAGKWCNDGRLDRRAASGAGQPFEEAGYAVMDEGEMPGLAELASDIREGASDICEVVGDGLGL